MSSAESDPPGLHVGGVSVRVIYPCAVYVNAWRNGLWATTLTEYGPMCKGECTENDVCAARCLTEVRCKMCIVIEVGKCASTTHSLPLVTGYVGYCL